MNRFFPAKKTLPTIHNNIRARRFLPRLEQLEDRVVPTLTLAPTIFTDPDLGVVAPDISLRSAIQTINGAPGETTAVINLSSGVYLMQQAPAPSPDDNTSGDFTINPIAITNITINGLPNGGTIIDAQEMDRVFQIIPFALNQPLTVTFNNVIIQHGHAGGANGFGGGIFFNDLGAPAHNDQLIVTSSVLVNNSADNDGGAIFSFNADITMTGDKVNLNGTAASGGGVATYLGLLGNTGSFYTSNFAHLDGGALWLGGDVLKTGVTPTGNVVIDSTGVQANVAEGSGGGYFDQNVGSLTVKNGSFFTGNWSGAHGGGLFFLDHAFTLTGSSVDGNHTNGDGGGFVDLASTGTASTGILMVSSSDISGNSAGGNGGGFANGTLPAINGAATVVISSTSFTGNFALDADSTLNGGGAVIDRSSLSLTVDGSVFVNNFSGNSGGALLLVSAQSLYILGRISGDLFQGNHAAVGGIGGAIANPVASPLFDLEQSLVAQNVAGSGGGVQTGAVSGFLLGDIFTGNVAISGNGGAFLDPTSTRAFLAANDFFSYNFAAGSGGSLFINATKAYFTNDQILYNTADVNGGGLDFTGQSLIITGAGPGLSTIQGNFAANNGGGIEADVMPDSTPLPLGTSSISPSIAVIGVVSALNVNNTDIIGNRAHLIGGGVDFISPNGGTLTVQNDLIQLNAAGDEGGGVAGNSAMNMFQDDVVMLNFSTEGGGGLDLIANPFAPAQLSSILQNYIANNYAGGDGGGVLADSNAGSYLEMVNNTMVGNTAGQHGGALANEGGTQTDVLFCTINANTASQGGGIYNNATGGADVPIAVGLGDNIIAGNFAAPSAPLGDGSPAITGANGYAIFGLFSDSLYTPALVTGPNGPAAPNVVGHNYIDALGPVGSYTAAYLGDLTAANDDNVILWIDFNQNPPSNYLGAPAYNGGPTQPPGFLTEIPLNPTLNNSGPNPVLDDGVINAVVLAFFPGGKVVDQIGQARPMAPSSFPDLGAFEVNFEVS